MRHSSPFRRTVTMGLLFACLIVCTSTAASGERPFFRWIEGSHGNEVTGVAYSPDGSVLASIGDDGTIKFWRSSDGRLLRTMPAAISPTANLTFSPNGATLAVGIGGITLYRLSDGYRSKVRLESFDARTIEFHPDGHHIAWAGENEVVLYELVTEMKSWSVACPAPGMDLAFSPDGSEIAVAFRDKVIRVFRAADGFLLHTLTGGTAPMLCVTYSHNGAFIAGGSEGHERKIRLWNASDGALIRSWYASGSAVVSLAFSPDDSLLAEGSRSSPVTLWDVESGQMQQCQGPTANIVSVCFAPDGTTIAGADSTNHTVCTWYVGDGSPQYTLAAHREPVTTVAYSPDGRWVASSGDDGLIMLRRSADGAFEREIGRHDLGVNAILFSPDGSRIISAGDDARVRIWNVKRAELEKVLRASHRDVYCLSLSADGSLLATGADDGLVKLWRLPHGDELWTGSDHEYGVVAVAVSPDGQWVASGGYDGILRIWRAADGTLDRRIPSRYNADITSLQFDPNGGPLAMGNGIGEIYLYSPQDFRFLRYFACDSVTRLAFLNHAPILLSSDKDGVVSAWNWDTGKLIRTFDQETAPFISSLSPAPDDQSLAIGRTDGSVGVIETPLCDGPGRLLRTRCKSQFGRHRGVTLILGDGVEGETYHAALAGGEQTEGIANANGRIKLKFRNQNAPFCGPTRVYVCGFESPIDCPCK